MGRGTSNVLSYRYATRPESSHTGQSMTNVAAQHGYERADGARTLRIPFHYGCGRLQRLRTATHQHFRWSEPVWSPRRNRTGDPILTMNRRPSAVLSGVFAGRSAPWMPQLWAQLRAGPGPAQGSSPRPSTKGALFKPLTSWVWGLRCWWNPAGPVSGGGFGFFGEGVFGFVGEFVAEQDGEGLGEVPERPFGGTAADSAHRMADPGGHPQSTLGYGRSRASR